MPEPSVASRESAAQLAAVGLAPLMRSKSRPRDEPDDAAKDNADLAVLTRLTSA